MLDNSLTDKSTGKYFLPVAIYFKSGITENMLSVIKTETEGRKISNVCIIVGKHVVRDGTADRIKKYFSGVNIEILSNVSVNPTVAKIEEIRSAIERIDPDAVIGIGGGSILDTAKSVAVLAKNNGGLFDFLAKRKNISERGIPFFAMPTTAGTGSEVTPWATIWGEDKKKYSLSSPMMYPRAAICDPALTMNMPPYITAYTGMDTLSHAIESYWSIRSSFLSDIHALRSIRLSANNLKRAIENPGNLVYRKKLMLASLEAGRAFSQTATTAVHSVSYPMTAYFGIPHGYACALTLAEFLKYNYEVTEYDCNDKRGHKFVRKKIINIINSLGCDRIDDVLVKINNIMKTGGLRASLREAGVDNFDIIIKNGFTGDRVANNPRFLSPKRLRDILKNIY